MSNISVNKNYRVLLVYLCFAIAALLTAYFMRMAFVNKGYDLGVDVFYHIKMGDLFPHACIDKTFPWTQLSVWKTNFYDKELGFHVLLSGIISFEKILGIKLAPPFNFINLILISLLTLVVILGCYKDRLTSSIMVAPLILFASPLFFLRINMIRPHVISIIFFLLILFCINSERSQRFKIYATLFLCWIYSYCYSVPHLAIFAVLSCVISSLILVSKKQFKFSIFLIIVAFLGILGGIIIHPQFPNSVYCWYIQGVLVVKKILGLNTGFVDLGLELISPTKATILENLSVFILLIINISFLIFLRKKMKPAYHSISFFIAGLLMTIGFLFSERCIEYAVPCNVICFAYLLDLLFREKRLKSVYQYMICFLIVIIVFIAMFNVNKKYLKDSQFTPCQQFGVWGSKHITSGTYIGQIRWGDFPRLFYSAPQFRYSMAMDPMFSYYKFPQRTELLEKFKLLKSPILPKDLAVILKTNLVFISKYDPVPAKYLAQKGAKILYNGSDGWLLLLN